VRPPLVTVATLLRLIHRGSKFSDLSYFLTSGVSSSFERSEFIFSLVMRFAPVSTFSGTFSPLDAASGLDAFVAHAERILDNKRLDIAVR
jgi:hypothetical protein